MNQKLLTIKFTGPVSLEDIQEKLADKFYDIIDAREAAFGTEQEEWQQCIGYSHCGPVYGASGVRTVDTLSRFIEKAWTERLMLPDEIMRRHMNRIVASPRIRVVEIGPNNKLFSMRGDVVLNKKGTKTIYDPNNLPSIEPINTITAIEIGNDIEISIDCIPMAKILEYHSKRAFLEDIYPSEYYRRNLNLSETLFLNGRNHSIKDVISFITAKGYRAQDIRICESLPMQYAVDMTFGQFMDVLQEIKSQWKDVINPFPKEKTD